jgi:hypothetical protein
MTTLSIHRGTGKAPSVQREWSSRKEAGAPAPVAATPVAATPVAADTTQPSEELLRMRLWMTLIIGVLVIALASIAAAVVLILLGKPDLASGAWPIATAAVAGIVGLFAKSPTAG